jgi:hypothetical protein
MEHDWLDGIFTAFLLAPPSVLGVRSLIRGPTRFAGKVVPIGMDRLAAAVSLDDRDRLHPALLFSAANAVRGE